MGQGLILQNNSGDDIAVTADGTFGFAAALKPGSAYSVTVKTQPSGPTQMCTVNAGAGTLADADVNNVKIVCATQSFLVGGTVTGLAGTGLVLQNNAGDDLAVAANGRFTFATPVASAANFAVTVKTPPGSPTQTCSVSRGTGQIGGVAVDNVAVVCSTTSYFVSGTITGLTGSSSVGLQNNGGSSIYLQNDGPFTFPDKVASGSLYAVTVNSQPSSQVCTVVNGSGVVATSNVTNLAIVCSTQTFSVGGTVSGLEGTGLVLQNNAGDDLPITADGSFSFATEVASASSFNVTVKTQPKILDQTCTVANGTGLIMTAGTTSVAITCVTATARAAYIGMFQGPPVTGVAPHMISNNVINSGVSPLGAMGSVGPYAVAVDPSSKNVYAVNGDWIYQFGIANPIGVGLLVKSPILTQPGSVGIIIDPQGKYLYVCNVLQNYIEAFSIDQTSGALTHIGVTPTGIRPRSGTIDPTGRFLYVFNESSNNVSTYTIQPNGTLSAATNYAVGISPTAITLDPTGKFLYVGHLSSSYIMAFAVDQTTGALSNATAYATSNRPSRLAMHPKGKYLYAGEGDGTTGALMTQYSIDATTGALTPASNLPSGATLQMVSMSVDPTGRYLFTLSQDMQATFAIDQVTGALTAHSGFTLQSANGTSMAIAR
ncbi:beta-propeller fold lactonase family protein [Variovorax sp. KK3]|uniref:lactonase family protein n=1 Tax=Variovorax sp. KK3 TaxID=1855728 RepID=UPI00097BAA7D|nr:beta-propeller fold lactonase family protein [Variovorax sp. KK3]